MKRTGPLKRTAGLARTSPMRRTRMKRRPRRAKPGDDPARLRWLRAQPCAACGRIGPSHAHHPRHGVGLALKAPDSDAIPLCASDPRTGRLGCHDALHRRHGLFWGWDSVRVMCWEMAQTARYQERYAAERAA